MELIVGIALLGAVTGTAALALDLIKWIRSGPRLKVRTFQATYTDAAVVSSEIIDGQEVKHLQRYYHIEVVNRGNLPSTIINISASARAKYNCTTAVLGFSGEAFVPHSGKKLPYVIKPGEVWSCRIEYERFKEKIMGMKPYELEIKVSHRDKTIKKKMPLSEA